MANDIDVDFSSVNELKQDNPNVSLRDIIMSATQMYSAYKQEERKDLKLQFDNLSSTIGSLHYNQSDKDIDASNLEPLEGVEIVDGQVNLFDYNYALAAKRLEEFKETSSKFKSKSDKELNKFIIQDANAKLALHSTQRDVKEQSLDKLEELSGKLINLTKSDNFFEDSTSLQQSTDLLNALRDQYNQLNQEFGRDFSSKHIDLYNEMMALGEFNRETLGVDVKDKLEGVQIAIDNPASPQLQEWLKERGMITEGKPFANKGEMLQTYKVDPELYSISQDYLDGLGKDLDELTEEERIAAFSSGAYQKADVGMYANALKAFNKYDLAKLQVQTQDLILARDANALEPFQEYKSLAIAGSAMDEEVALAVGHEFFENPNKPNRHLKNIKNTPNQIVREGAIAMYEDYVAKFGPLFEKGRMTAEVKDMQKDYLGIKQVQEVTLGKDIKDLREDQASKIKQNMGMLVKNIEKNVDTKGHKWDIDIPPAYAEGTITGSTGVMKRFMTDALTQVLATETGYKGIKGRASSEDDMINKFLTAKDTGKWGMMAQLVNKYLKPSGMLNEDETWLNPITGDVENVDLNDVFDTKGWGAKHEKDRRDLFINVLQTFQVLMQADPAGIIMDKTTFGF